MKKRRPRNRPPKLRRKKHEAQAAPQVDPVSARLNLLEVTVAALVEVAGRDAVRKANAKIGSARGLAALAGHVAAGKLAETKVVTPDVTCAVELSEHTMSGEVVTESVVAELARVDPAHAAALAGAAVGEMRELGAYKVQVRRCWDVVTPVEATP